MFIRYLTEDPQYYFMAVFSVVVSIVLHELAHGMMAIRLGDRTPILMGRMTPNPLVHMGGMSLAMLAIAGIAWGAMPINPARMRGRYSQALVAAAGPACNLILALLALTALVLLVRSNGSGELSQPMANGIRLLEIFGTLNVMLCLFNLVPLPPLDGSKILGNFSHGFQQAMDDPQKQQQFFIGFLFAFIFLGKYLIRASQYLASTYCQWLMAL